MMQILTVRKHISILLSLCLSTHIAFGSHAESSVWDQRRESLSTRSSKSDQIASLPANRIGLAPTEILKELPAINSSLPHQIDPSSFLDRKFGEASEGLKSILHSIPLTHGNVQGVYDAGSNASSTVILIQDIHLNAEAQRNIAEILQNLITDNKIDFVGVEGAFNKFDFSRFRFFGNKEITKKVAKAYLERNLLAAPSYVGMTSPVDPPLFFGVDDIDHYEANVLAYKKSLIRKDGRINQLSIQKRRLDKAKQDIYSPELKRFDLIHNRHQTGNLGLGSYAKILSTYQDDIPLVVEQFLNAYRMETSLNFDLVERERKKVIEKLSEFLSEKKMQELLALSLAYRMGRINFGHFYQSLRDLCQSHNVPLKKFPAFDDYIRYVLLSDGINAQKLFSEIRNLEEAVFNRLAITPQQKELVLMGRQVQLTEKILEFELTPAEWDEYRSHKNENLDVFESFYHEADIRSEKIVENLTRFSDEKAKAMVVGGFHTPYITQLLKESRTSYIIVSPKVTKVETESGNKYLSVFAREKTPIEQLFSGEKLFVSPRFGNIDLKSTNQFMTGEVALENSLKNINTPMPENTVVQIVKEGIYRIIVDGAKRFVVFTEKATGFDLKSKRPLGGRNAVLKESRWVYILDSMKEFFASQRNNFVKKHKSVNALEEMQREFGWRLMIEWQTIGGLIAYGFSSVSYFLLFDTMRPDVFLFAALFSTSIGIFLGNIAGHTFYLVEYYEKRGWARLTLEDETRREIQPVLDLIDEVAPLVNKKQTYFQKRSNVSVEVRKVLLTNLLREYPVPVAKNFLTVFKTYLGNEVPGALLFKGFDATLLESLTNMTGKFQLWTMQAVKQFYYQLNHQMREVRVRTGEEPIVIEVAAGHGDLSHELKKMHRSARIIPTDGFYSDVWDPKDGDLYDAATIKERGVKKLRVEEIVDGSFRSRLDIPSDAPIIVIASHLPLEGEVDKSLFNQSEVDDLIFVSGYEPTTNNKATGQPDVTANEAVWEITSRTQNSEYWYSGVSSPQGRLVLKIETFSKRPEYSQGEPGHRSLSRHATSEPPLPENVSPSRENWGAMILARANKPLKMMGVTLGELLDRLKKPSAYRFPIRKTKGSFDWQKFLKKKKVTASQFMDLLTGFNISGAELPYLDDLEKTFDKVKFSLEEAREFLEILDRSVEGAVHPKTRAKHIQVKTHFEARLMEAYPTLLERDDGGDMGADLSLPWEIFFGSGVADSFVFKVALVPLLEIFGLPGHTIYLATFLDPVSSIILGGLSFALLHVVLEVGIWSFYKGTGYSPPKSLNQIFNAKRMTKRTAASTIISLVAIIPLFFSSYSLGLDLDFVFQNLLSPQIQPYLLASLGIAASLHSPWNAETYAQPTSQKEEMNRGRDYLIEFAIAFAKEDGATALDLLQDRAPISVNSLTQKEEAAEAISQFANRITEDVRLKQEFLGSLKQAFSEEGLSLEGLSEERRIYLLVFLMEFGIDWQEITLPRELDNQNGYLTIVSEETEIQDMAALLLKSKSNILFVPKSKKDTYGTLIQAFSRVKGSRFKADVISYNNIEELAGTDWEKQYGHKVFIVDNTLRSYFPGFLVLQDILKKLLSTPMVRKRFDQFKAIYEAIKSAA